MTDLTAEALEILLRLGIGQRDGSPLVKAGNHFLETTSTS